MSQIPNITIGYSFKAKLMSLPKITNSTHAFNIAWNEWDHNKIGYCEQFGVILLNRNNRVLGFALTGEGSSSAVVVDAKKIFQLALMSNACQVILVHNHPSGISAPSQSDIEITKKLKKGADLLDLQVIDHIILSPDNCFTSLADEGHI